MTPAEELRAAAAKLRETASELGVWHYDSRNSVVCENEYIVAARVHQPDAAWIALIGPDKAEPLAAFLDVCARQQHLWAGTSGNPNSMSSEHEAALAFARSVLGEKA